MKTRPLSPRSILYTIVWKRVLKTKIQSFLLYLGWNSDHHLLGVYRLFKTQPLPTFLTVSYYPQPHWLCFSSMDLLPVSKTASGPLCLLFPLPKCCSSWRLPDSMNQSPLTCYAPWRHLTWPSVTKNSPLLHHSLLFPSKHVSLSEICFFLLFHYSYLFPPISIEAAWGQSPLSFHPSVGIPGIYLTPTFKVRTQ